MTNPIIMLAGLPGTGKSTIAKKLKDKLDYDIHSLLEVRRDFKHKRYDPKQNPIVFRELYNKTEKSLQQSRGVILDTTYTTQGSRSLVYEIARDYDKDILIIESHCSRKESKKRMRSRPLNDGLVAEPRNPRVYDKLAERWQNITIDINAFSDVSINYVKYNSETNSLKEVRVNESLHQLVNTVKSTLSSNFQTPSTK